MSHECVTYVTVTVTDVTSDVTFCLLCLYPNKEKEKNLKIKLKKREKKNRIKPSPSFTTLTVATLFLMLVSVITRVCDGFSEDIIIISFNWCECDIRLLSLCLLKE